MTACRYTSCVLADSPASFMSSIIRVRIADIVCSFVIDGTTRLDADDSLTSYSSGDAATPPRLRHRRSRPFNGRLHARRRLLQTAPQGPLFRRRSGEKV